MRERNVRPSQLKNLCVERLVRLHPVLSDKLLGYYPQKVAKSQPQKKSPKPTPSSTM
jgi:hypothetical protein